MSKRYVKLQMEVTVLGTADVVTFSTENYVDWNVQEWFIGNGGTGYGPWNNEWNRGN